MSGFAGLLNLDGAAADPALLDRMAAALAYRARDGMGRWRGGPIGLVHARLWTTPEEVGEEQPIGDSGTWLAADARVDNRDELLERLAPSCPGIGPEASDARLLLAGYRVFGDRLCEEVLGDFAFALWDGKERRLVLARDSMAMRQLYYTLAGRTLVFGSTIGAVLAALPEPPPLNRNLIEGFLQDSYRHWITETIHQGVVRFPAGSVVVASADGVRQRRWWSLGSTWRRRPPSEEDWVEAFRRAFDEAVRCRMRSHTPVAVLAGGGLDSASIACVAHAGLPAGGQDRLRLLALTFEETPSADETEYLEHLAAWLRGVEVGRIPADCLPLALGDREDDDQPLDEPEIYLLRSHTEALFGAAARSGCRVVLAGEAANAVLGHPFYHDRKALALVGPRHFLAELPHFRSGCRSGIARLLAHAWLWPLVPAFVQDGLRRLRGGRGKRWVRAAGPGSWRRRLPPLPEPAWPAGFPRAARWASQWIGRPFDLARHGAMDVTAAHAGVEWRQPFLDRRVVDLLMHLPVPLRSWRGEDRRVLRLAMNGRMPEQIRRRQSKIHINEVVDRRLRGEQRGAVESLLDNPRAVALDYVSDSVKAAFARYWNGEKTAFDLLSFLCLESWLRRTEVGTRKKTGRELETP